MAWNWNDAGVDSILWLSAVCAVGGFGYAFCENNEMDNALAVAAITAIHTATRRAADRFFIERPAMSWSALLTRSANRAEETTLEDTASPLSINSGPSYGTDQ
ncbi:MAG: hypothetical protein COB66_08875 [Coxiella sp. (in: Bacteria)]|nr:MAG: hypothetical protein COB66_08875 [Coxiella sp. (in: g-proteobacteria)]